MIDPSAWQPRAATLFAGAALVWAVSLYGLFVDERLVYALALVPRRIDGLSGILSAPWCTARSPTCWQTPSLCSFSAA